MRADGHEPGQRGGRVGAFSLVAKGRIPGQAFLSPGCYLRDMSLMHVILGCSVVRQRILKERGKIGKNCISWWHPAKESYGDRLAVTLLGDCRWCRYLDTAAVKKSILFSSI